MSEKKDNTIHELRAMMFDQMKRINDPNQDLEMEIKRSQALVSAGTVIVNSVKVEIDHMRVSQAQGKGKKGVKEIGNG